MTASASRWRGVWRCSRLPQRVKVVDFGIRGIDLTYALLDGCEAAILVDTAQRGERPGTISIVEPELPAADPDPEDLLLPLHDLDPAKVLRVVARWAEPAAAFCWWPASR